MIQNDRVSLQLASSKFEDYPGNNTAILFSIISL